MGVSDLSKKGQMENNTETPSDQRTEGSLDIVRPIVKGDMVKVKEGFFMPGMSGIRKVIKAHECWLIVEGDGGYLPASKFELA